MHKNSLLFKLTSGRVGGIQIEGLGSTDIDNQPEFQNSGTLGGLSLEFHRRISAVYDRLPYLEKVVAENLKDPLVWKFESKVAEKVISSWLAEHDIDIVYASLREQGSLSKNGQTIQSIRLTDNIEIKAKIFVDASYEGDLLHRVGISTTFGRESSSTYGESLNGIRSETPYRQFDKPIDPYRTPGDPTSGTIFGVSDEPFGIPGDADKHLPAFSYRVPLTNIAANQKPITKPKDYDPSQFELHRRFAEKGGTFYLPAPRVPNSKTDLIGSEAVLATDLLGLNDDWLVVGDEGRTKILKETTSFTQGLLYFFTSDPSLPASVRSEWSKWGYCLDEFPDNDHFPRQLYVRAGRRMISDYIITEHTASLNGEDPVSDPVAVACWPTDTHCSRRVIRNGVVHNEGFIFKDGHKWIPFGISYRALVPKRIEATNIITPTCPSSSHVGYGKFYCLL
ncbi:hypothetical protein N0V90_004489 [Kalmusia sp. IMI 367209]|nr:hypothetical protein N0V90_004489 [Kalmusia sp. IMI 367209]